MAGIKRALLFSSGERYFTILLNFLLIAAVSRILTPQEVGVSVIGATIIAFAENIRDCPSGYLVQKAEVTREDVRTAFTIMLGITVVIAAGLYLLSGWLATILRYPGIEPFLKLISVGLLPACIERPLMALLRRDMKFATYAAVSIVSATIAAIVTISLAVAGFSYMSFGWGLLAGSSSAALLALWFQPKFWIYRLHLSEWRQVVPFNAYSGASAILGVLYDMLPYTVLGHLSQMNTVGFYNRSVMICRLPDKLNTGVVSLALPAFSSVARGGQGLAQPFLRALTYLTVVEWPMRILLVFCAYPVVMIVLGPQWEPIVPVVQIVSIALLMATLQLLTYPILVAAGGIRDTFLVNLVTWPFSAAALTLSAFHGLLAMAWVMALIVPVQAIVTLYFIRRRVPFSLAQLGGALEKSVFVTIASAVGPCAVVMMNGGFKLTVIQFFVSAVLALGGWLAGVWAAGHPVKAEIQLGYAMVVRQGGIVSR